MYKQFLFEGDIHESLECVPLTVRRKLDLAALKISLAGWQALPRSSRLALCHLSVGSEVEIAIYRDFMLTCCREAAVPLKPLDDPSAATRAWNADAVPDMSKNRMAELGVVLTNAEWRSFDEEARYALVKLADPKRNPLKMRALLVELGILPGPAPVIQLETVVCEPVKPPQSDRVHV